MTKAEVIDLLTRRGWNGATSDDPSLEVYERRIGGHTYRYVLSDMRAEIHVLLGYTWYWLVIASAEYPALHIDRHDRLSGWTACPALYN